MFDKPQKLSWIPIKLKGLGFYLDVVLKLSLQKPFLSPLKMMFLKDLEFHKNLLSSNFQKIILVYEVSFLYAYFIISYILYK